MDPADDADRRISRTNHVQTPKANGVAAQVPGNGIKARVQHPQVLAVKTWALAHLLANNTLADVLLFGGFLLWAVLVGTRMLPGVLQLPRLLVLGQGLRWREFAATMRGRIDGLTAPRSAA